MDIDGAIPIAVLPCPPASRYTPPVTTFQQAYDELRQLGLFLLQSPGEYRLSVRRDAATPPLYVTDDLHDALNRGREIAPDLPPPEEPPLGPTGSRRAFMVQHNRKIAARRRKRNNGR